MMKGLNLWTDSILGIKNTDVAIIYTFIISIFLILNKKWKIPRWPIRKFYIATIITFGLCALFSLIYYRLSPYQILQGGRGFLLIFSLPILIKIQHNELVKILRLLLFFCICTSILYITQIIIQRPLMPYGNFVFDYATGLPRFYNIPANLPFFLTLTFLYPKLFKGHIYIYKILFIFSAICSLGRTFIITTIATVLIAMLMQGKLKRANSAIVILCIILVPFWGIISERFAGAGGTSDIANLTNGDYKDYKDDNMSSGTMVYRIAWVYERWNYMTKRPINELLLGLGFVSDSQSYVDKHYNFSVGIIEEETEKKQQLATGDISYGNILTKLGLLGGSIYLVFALSLTIFLYKKRKYSILLLTGAALMTTSFLMSFSSTSLSDTKNLGLIFMILSVLNYHKNNRNNTQKNEISTY